MQNRPLSWLPPSGVATPLVIVAEDDDALRALFVDVLVHQGYRVVGVPDGAALCRMLDALVGHPVVVVSDQRLPHVWGLDCLAAHGTHAAFILVTGHADSALRASAAHHGVAAVYDKPLDLDVLVRAVEDASQRWAPKT